jgi:hypothetical protein
MVDLNNPDSYSIVDFGGGNTLYRDSSNGMYYDPGDMSTPLTTADVQSYGSPSQSGAISPSVGLVSSQSQYGSAAPSPTVNSGGSGGMNLSGLSGMFTAVGGAFASLINQPKTTPGGAPLVYDAVRGAYVPASSVGASVSNISSIPMWLVIGGVVIVAILVLRKG